MSKTREQLVEHISARSGLRTRELAAALEVDAESFESFVEELMALQREGRILRIPGRGWFSPERTDFRVGKIKVARGGYAFVVLPQPDPLGDLFVPAGKIGSAFSGDIVLVEIVPARKGRKGAPLRGGSRLREGRVLDVLERRKSLVRGRFRAAQPKGPARRKGRSASVPGFVEPLERSGSEDIFIGPGSSGDARDGQKVLVRLLVGHDHAGIYARGEVVHVLSEDGDFESDFLEIAAEHAFPVEQSADALREAKRLKKHIGPGELEGRDDLRESLIFTIDPDDAQDFDDAVSLEVRRGGVVRLGVHIADVSHWVPPDSKLDESARERGTSIYLPGRVVPMLPERIANDLASLRPKEDRLTKSVFMDFDAKGELVRTRIARTVIRSKRRFTYDEVLAILEDLDERAGRPPRRPAGSEPIPVPDDADRYEEVLGQMASLRDTLHRRRRERGCLELELPSLRLEVDKSNGDVRGLLRDVTDPSHQLIEEFMLAANEAVASYMERKGLPIVVRVHDAPEEDSLALFFDLVKTVESQHGVRSTRSTDVQAVIERVAGQPYASIIAFALLKSVAHAEYSAEPGLHYALATEHYCHFTLPIRRYPDLLVHQILDEHLTGALRARGRKREWNEALPKLAAESSATERRAEEAERDMIRLRLIRYLADFQGEEFEGVITGVHPFGFFVQDPLRLIDGLVHITSLGDDYYDYDEESLCLRGRRGGQIFHLGDRVRVVLDELNPDFREIRLRFVKHLGGRVERRTKKKRRR